MSKQFTSGSIQVTPIYSVSRKLNIRWSVSSGTAVFGPDRTGQLVSHGDLPEIWLVRETLTERDGRIHVIVKDDTEQLVGEDTFWPWGAWHPRT
jgi:hypothetical protein